MGRIAGFTLVELIVTMSVAAILVTVAVPSYRRILTSSRLSTLANEYVLAINEARMEAIRRNATAQVCAPSGNGTGDLATFCGTTSAGAIYVTPTDPADDPVLVRAAPALSPTLQIASFQALRYNAQGLARAPGVNAPYAGLVADLYTDQTGTDSHRCIYMTTGTSLKTCPSDSDCDASTEPANCQ